MYPSSSVKSVTHLSTNSCGLGFILLIYSRVKPVPNKFNRSLVASVVVFTSSHNVVGVFPFSFASLKKRLYIGFAVPLRPKTIRPSLSNCSVCHRSNLQQRPSGG